MGTSGQGEGEKKTANVLGNSPAQSCSRMSTLSQHQYLQDKRTRSLQAQITILQTYICLGKLAEGFPRGIDMTEKVVSQNSIKFNDYPIWFYVNKYRCERKSGRL